MAVTDPDSVAIQKTVQKPKEKTISKPFWGPILTILWTLVIFFGAQLIAGILVSGYLTLRGFDSAQITSWLAASVGQFWVILLVEISIVWLTWLFLRWRRVAFGAIKLKRPKPGDVTYAVVGYIAYLVLFLAVSALAKVIFSEINFNQKQQIGFESAKQTSELMLVFLSLVIATPIAEEILTRGFLYTGLKTKFPRWLAVIVTSVMFAVAHLQFSSGAPLLWVAAIDTFTLSLILIYLREKTDSLAAPILLHMLKNGVAFVLLFVIRVS